MASIKNLHLQYRLWIAEMNADISVIRIFDDYLAEMAKDTDKDALKQVENYKKEFTKIRNVMDELRHQMHLNKMKLAAAARNKSDSIDNIEKEISHKEIRSKYKDFRKKFKATKKEFRQLETSE